MSNGDGSEYVPNIKSRQPGPRVSGSVTKVTSSTIKGSDSSSSTGTARWIGTDPNTQLQTKDTGIHIQPGYRT